MSDRRRLAQLLDVLTSSSLPRGTCAIRKVAVASDKTVPKDVEVFHLTAETLSKYSSEYLIIPHEHWDVERLKNFVEAFDPSRTIGPNVEPGSIFIVSDIDLQTNNPANLKAIRLNELFGTLVRVPAQFSEMLLENVRPDFSSAEFKERYLKRRGAVRGTTVQMTKEIPWPSEQRVIAVSDYLAEWATVESKRSPIFLLGNRGSGKTWELVHFCLAQLERHRSDPWQEGLPLFFPLREFRRFFSEAPEHMPSLAELCLEEYPEVRVKWDVKLLRALIESGNVILCLDAIDEMALQPSDVQAHETIEWLLSVVSPRTKLVVSVRPTYFRSMQFFLSQITRGNRSTEGVFEVIELLPFGPEDIRNYVEIATHTRLDLRNRIIEDFAFCSNATKEFTDCLRKVSSEIFGVLMAIPAALRHLVYMSENQPDSLASISLAVGDLIDRLGIQFNIRTQKTLKFFNNKDCVVDLSAEQRKLILEAVAGTLADQGTMTFSNDELDGKISLSIGTSNDAIVRDLRAQTVLELEEGAFDVTAGVQDHDVRLRFAFSVSEEDEYDCFMRLQGLRSGNPIRREIAPLERLKRLRDEAARVNPLAVSGIAGGYFLARWVVRRLMEVEALRSTGLLNGSLQDGAGNEYLLSPIGRFPLGPAVGVLVRDMLDHAPQLGLSNGSLDHRETANRLKDIAIETILEKARRRDYSVFSPRLRYLCHNLEAIGLITPSERKTIDPWTDEIAEITRSPASFSWRMVLIPPVPSDTYLDQLKKAEISSDEIRNFEPQPYLLAAHEVTNNEFVTFLESPDGEDWRPERITNARGILGQASRFRERSNEYHLYHWEKVKDVPYDSSVADTLIYKPPPQVGDHPVSYVSWWCCAAFCNWLNRQNGLGPQYDIVTGDIHSGHTRSVDGGFRLPDAREWWWAAQGGRLDTEYPWELYPFHLPHGPINKLQAVSQLPTGLGDRINRERKFAQNWLTQRSHGTHPVGDDLFPSFGVFGLIGNVKEWCSNTTSEKVDKRKKLILGASSVLGYESFRFDYCIPLFPENTNPDVGFRVARSLSMNEIQLLRKRENELAISGF